MKKLIYYVKMLYQIFKRDVINKEDYKNAYNKVADTYQVWLEAMGKHTDFILDKKHMPFDKKIKILDFACGTGYITKKLLKLNIDCTITAVDYSDTMLKKVDVKNISNVNIINSDGIEFLKNTNEKFDIIYCGWALPYFNHNELISLFNKVLKKQGIVGVVSNSFGTLNNIEQIFIEVMKENLDQVSKPMMIGNNLPDGESELIRWFDKCGFSMLNITQGEEKFSFDKPEKLLDWLNETGAIAGTEQIFKDYEVIKPKIIDKIRKYKYSDDGKYIINHKFISGIFVKGGMT